MGVKPWKSRQQLINTLIQERHLQCNSNYDLDTILKENNYFQLINGLESFLLPETSSHPKIFSTENVDDFLRLYRFDKELKRTIQLLTEKFEDKLKTSIAHNFSKNHCMILNDTMQYTNKANFIDIGSNNEYPFKRYQYKKICDNFENFSLFKRSFVNDLVNHNDFINPTFYRSNEYLAPSGVTYYSCDRKVAVPFWVTIQTLDFGTLVWLLHYSQDSDMRDILNDFNLPFSKKFFFLNALDIIKELRNNCAHGALLLRFRTPKYIKLNRNLVSSLQLTPYHNGGNTTHPSNISLFDSLKVLKLFVNMLPLKKVFKKIIYANNRYFHKESYDLNQRILLNIGASSYQEIKTLFY